MQPPVHLAVPCGARGRKCASALLRAPGPLAAASGESKREPDMPGHAGQLGRTGCAACLTCPAASHTPAHSHTPHLAEQHVPGISVQRSHQEHAAPAVGHAKACGAAAKGAAEWSTGLLSGRLRLLVTVLEQRVREQQAGRTDGAQTLLHHGLQGRRERSSPAELTTRYAQLW